VSSGTRVANYFRFQPSAETVLRHLRIMAVSVKQLSHASSFCAAGLRAHVVHMRDWVRGPHATINLAGRCQVCRHAPPQRFPSPDREAASTDASRRGGRAAVMRPSAEVGHLHVPLSDILDQKSPGWSPGGAIEGPGRLAGGQAFVVSAAVQCWIYDQGVRVLERNDDAQCGSVVQPEPQAGRSPRCTITDQ